MYNALPPIEKQVELGQGSQSKHIKALLAIINSHGMGDYFGVHSLHRHDEVPGKTVRLEADLPSVPSMKWTRATPNTKELLVKDKMRPTFFKVEGDSLVAFEFAMGPSPFSRQKLSHQFITDVYDLTNLIALELGDFTEARAMNQVPTGELEVVWGSIEKFTVSLPLNRMREGVVKPVFTGWNVKDDHPENVDSEPPAG
ncbi:MAG: hypothetical protein Q9196_001095 [Gyalolechia fulgens]